jgi:hypothetical protein
VVQPAGDLSANLISLFLLASLAIIEETMLAEDESLTDRRFYSFDKSLKNSALKLN